MSSAVAKEIGEELEYRVTQRADRLELVGDGEATWHDAQRDDGTPVEIKTCAYRVSSGPTSRRGRFYIKRAAHEQLLDAGGQYRFAVYDTDRSILAEVSVPAAVVDETITGWVGDGSAGTYAAYAQVRWPLLFDEIPEGSP